MTKSREESIKFLLEKCIEFTELEDEKKDLEIQDYLEERDIILENINFFSKKEQDRIA